MSNLRAELQADGTLEGRVHIPQFPSKMSELENDIPYATAASLNELRDIYLLSCDQIIGAIETRSRNSSGKLVKITHTDGLTGEVLREDTFAYTSNATSETRTLPSNGAQLTLTLTLATLRVAKTYTPGT